MKDFLQKHKQYLLTGVSYVIPFIACGGILLAVAITLAFHFGYIDASGRPDFSKAPEWLRDLSTIGGMAFNLFPAVLAGFISYGMAGRPGLVPGFIGGAIAGMPQTVNGETTSAGFLGAMLIGLVAGHVTNWLKKLPAPKWLKPIMPIIIIPVGSAVPVGLLMLVLDLPMTNVMLAMGHFLSNIPSGQKVFLAMILGAMIAFDMGGPVNKTAFFFGVAMIREGNPTVMGACAAAICIPPLGLGLATLLAPRHWSKGERESGLAALAMGAIGITEGAIPFAVADPFRIIPTIMAGSALGGAIAMLGAVGDHAPHGGLIVIPVVDHLLWYLLAIGLGTLTVALTTNLLTRRPLPAVAEETA